MGFYFISVESEKSGEGKKGKGGEKEKKCTEKKQQSCSRVVCILFMSVTYSTDTDIKTVAVTGLFRYIFAASCARLAVWLL